MLDVLPRLRAFATKIATIIYCSIAPLDHPTIQGALSHKEAPARGDALFNQGTPAAGEPSPRPKSEHPLPGRVARERAPGTQGQK